MKCEACGYKFLFAPSTQCPSCGDLREDIVADGYDFLTANAVPIMDSTVGLKAANAHLTRRVAELEAEKSRRDIIAQNITPVGSLQPLNAEASYAEQMEGLKGLPSLGAEAWFEIAMAYLTRQLAAQALAHAEQMEGKTSRIAELEAEVAELHDGRRAIAIDAKARIETLESKFAAQALAHAEQIRILQTRTYIAEGRVAELEGAANNLLIRLRDIWSPAMRVTPATTKLR